MNNLTEQFIAKMKELFGLNVITKLQSADHFSQGRGGKSIDTLTPHHMAGNLSINTLYNVLNAPGRQASCNIGIATNGDVAILVRLENRAWTSSSKANDDRAVTFEIANNGGGPNWSVSDLAKLRYKQCGIALAKVLGIKSFRYTGGTDGTVTRHNMFSATTCPGANLQGSLDALTREINEALVSEPAPAPAPTPTPEPSSKLAVGTKVRLKANAPLYVSSDAAQPNGYARAKDTAITRNNGSKHYYNTTGDYGWMDASGFDVIGGESTQKTHTVKSGEVLSTIAPKYGCSWQTLYGWNQELIDSEARRRGAGQPYYNHIYPGMVLQIKN